MGMTNFDAVNVKTSVINGGAAGNHTLTGIATTDRILSVVHVPRGFASGKVTISLMQATAEAVVIDTGLGAALGGYSISVVTTAGVPVALTDAVISDAAGVITLAGAATYAVTATDVVLWTAMQATMAVTPVDVTSEFSIGAANTIANAAGTATTGGLLIVLWCDKDMV